MGGVRGKMQVDGNRDPDAEDFLAPEPGEPSERDVWTAASLLIKQFGHDAVIFASMRADDWLAQGDLPQYRLTKRILSAIDNLLTTNPPVGVRPS